MFLGLSIVITTLSSVWNERIIKRYKAPLQQINMIMYFFGTILAFILYCAVPAYHEKGFFEGYSFMAFVVIFVQGTYGLSVGYAYKYARAHQEPVDLGHTGCARRPQRNVLWQAAHIPLDHLVGVRAVEAAAP